MRLDQVVNHISVLDLVMLARRSAVDRHGVVTEVPTDAREISEFVSRIYRRYIKQLCPDCYTRKNKYSFSIRMDSLPYTDMFASLLELRKFPDRLPTATLRTATNALHDRLQQSLHDHNLLKPFNRADGKFFIYLFHNTSIYNTSGSTFSAIIEQFISFCREWNQFYTTEYLPIKADLEHIKQEIAIECEREEAEREAAIRRVIEEQIISTRERAERLERERLERERLGQQIRERLAREQVTPPVVPERIVLRPISPGAPTVPQINQDYIEDEILDELEFEGPTPTTIQHAMDIERNYRDYVPPVPFTIPDVPSITLTPAAGTRVNSEEQERFNQLLRRVSNETPQAPTRDRRNEITVTAEIDIADMDTLVRNALRTRDINAMADFTRELRMVPPLDFFVTHSGSLIELNPRLREYIPSNQAYRMFDVLSRMPLPEGLPLTNIQFDKEYFSDVDATNPEEIIMEGPNGIYYVPTGPAYFIHVDDEVSCFSSYIEAQLQFTAKTGIACPVVFYPVISTDSSDTSGTTWASIPPDIGRLYDSIDNDLADADIEEW